MSLGIKLQCRISVTLSLFVLAAVDGVINKTIAYGKIYLIRNRLAVQHLSLLVTEFRSPL